MNNYLYKSREFDFDTGLYYNKFSYYNPIILNSNRYFVNNSYSYSYIENEFAFISKVEYKLIDFFKLNRIILMDTKYDYRICVRWLDCWVCYIYDDETDQYVGYIAKSGCVVSGLKL